MQKVCLLIQIIECQGGSVDSNLSVDSNNVYTYDTLTSRIHISPQLKQIE